MFIVTFERSIPDAEGWGHVTVYDGTGLFSTEANALAAIAHVFGTEPLQAYAWAPRGQTSQPIPGRYSNGHHLTATIQEITVDLVPQIRPDPLDKGCGTQNCLDY